MTIDPKIEKLARMWMLCDPNRGGYDPEEIIGQSCSGSTDGPTEFHDTPLTGKPRWHWFIPRAEASLAFFADNGLKLEDAA